MAAGGGRRNGACKACALAVANALAWTVTAGAAPPEDAAPAAIPEIVVSAERMASLARTTPVSIGVLGSADIESKGVRDLSDLAGLVAGVVVPNGFSNMPQAVAIRGVGGSVPAMRQAVGIYLDDVPLIRGYATGLWDLPDIERIEVLRGPQGTLYGQNSSAGAVKFITRDPGMQREAWVAASAGNVGTRALRGYITGALVDDALAGSLALSRRVNHGYGYNATTDRRVNRLDVLQAQGKLKWADAATSAVLALDLQRDRSDTNTNNYPLDVAGAAPRVTYSAEGTGAFERVGGGLALRIEHAFGTGLRLRAITAWRRYRDDPTIADFGGLPVRRYAIAQTIEQRAASQELQLQWQRAGWSATAGIMLVRDAFDFDRRTFAAPAAAPAAVRTEASTHQATLDAGLYAQARHALTASTGISAGMRVYRTRQTGRNAYWRLTPAGERAATIYDALGLETASQGVLPRLSLDHVAADGTYWYASVAEGERFGGFNRAAESLLSAMQATSPERVMAYEAGAKRRGAGGRWSAEAAVFYNDYRDYLAGVTGLVLQGVTVPDQVLVNAGHARTHGLDVALRAALGADTHWYASAELLRSRFTDFVNPSGVAVSGIVGKQLPNAPRLSGSMGIRHAQLLDEGGRATLDFSALYVRRHDTDINNTPALQSPSQVYLNTELAYSPAGDRWQFALRGKNLADRAFPMLRMRIPALGIDTAYYNPPRTIAVAARYKF